MKGLRNELSRDHDDEQCDENDAAEGVSQVHCHGKCVPARLAQCRGGYLDDPKGQSDLGNLLKPISQVPIVSLARYPGISSSGF